VFSIRSIALTDFGPFKGEQRIEFPRESGVSIIYGENMRGKTTLLNAIRYALFGKVIMRGATPVALHQIGNWESAIEKNRYGFKVILEFDNDGSEYQLTRRHYPRRGIEIPQSDADYQQERFLRKDGSVLGPNESDTELSRIMPENVSRFFLFDGELLQQYEELLRDESEMGRNIKEAIERILGVPVLINGRIDLGELSKDAQKREATAAQKNQQTRALGNQQEALLTQREGLLVETVRLKKLLEDARNNKNAQEDLLRKTEKIRSLLEERTNLQSTITDAGRKIKGREDRRKELLTDAWKGLLKLRISSTLDTMEQDLKTKRDDYQRSLILEEIIERSYKALSDGSCSTCGQALSGSAEEQLRIVISDNHTGEDHKEMETIIQGLESRISALKQSIVPGDLDVLQEIQDSIDEFKIDRATAQDRLTDLKAQTQDVDDSAIRRLALEHEKTLTEIGVIQEGIKNQDEALRVINDNIAKVESEITKFADADLDNERGRKELCDRLASLFVRAVDTYRDRLRDKVEKDATALFLDLTSEQEYKALRINDSYGLTIIHEDGSEILVRSAGAEHVVALSLMGALQRNAPLRGPIVMDSPFGRLDQEHTTRIIKALPSMADQVMLLVYESELEPDEARNHLQGKLRKEYRIVRRSARHSDIEPLV